MSRSTFLVVALSCAISYAAYGQQPSPDQPPAATANPQASPPPSATADTGLATSTTKVPMTEPVITLKNVCQPKAGATTPPPGCVSGLTRDQFEKLVKALQQPDKPPMPPDVVRNFASQYSKMLIFADAARDLGLENDPRFVQIFQFVSNQILTDALNQHIVQEYSHISDQQIEDYYKQNPKKYVEVTLQRILVSRTPASKDKPKSAEAEEQAYADKIRERWVAGEDPVKLQKEATDHSGLPNAAPDVNLGARRPGTVPEDHEAVFELKPGEVSPVLSDLGAFYIYKVLSVRQVPLSDVKSTISSTLQRQMITDRIEQIQKSATVVLNDAYFGPEVPRTVRQSIIMPKGAAGGNPAPPNATPAPPPSPMAPPK